MYFKKICTHMYFKDHEVVRSTVYIVQIKDHSLDNTRVI